MPDSILLAMLLVAISFGYLMGRLQKKKQPSTQVSTVTKDYFVGLNYLLNEQPDEAIDAFIHALDLGGDNVDAYLALGTLFCKRGEVERSIRVHQDLLARPSLTPVQSRRVQLELAKDYMYAGLFDRAEAMLTEMVKHHHELKSEALLQLLKIYEQEKEWLKAIDIAESLKRNQGLHYYKALALYYCEQAEEDLGNNNRASARRHIKVAFARDKDCVRASLLLGRMDYEEGRYRDAVRTLENIAKQNVRYISLSIPMLEKAYNNLPSTKGLKNYLVRCLNESPTSMIVLAMSRLIEKEQGKRFATNFLIAQLAKRPTLIGLNRLVTLQQSLGQLEHESFRLFKELTNKMLVKKPVFACSSCGFKSKEMYWQCPSCKQWSSISPITGLEGE
ncbi:MAG: lipopolysaccharide assembly protein LapB [Endozoicomonas sp. (ex Botrylloides leachii)]|nr:lipopolysaccharide assembly protein LapB [Endozoicomonas sp. (ex Botrylloides leachii)]